MYPNSFNKILRLLHSANVFLNYIYLIYFNSLLAYNIGLISAIHQHELVKGVHMSPPT